MSMRRSLRRLAGCTGGNALLEATIVLPVLIYILAAVGDFAMAYNDLASAQKSLSGAVRFLTTVPREAICGSNPWALRDAVNLAVYGKRTVVAADPPLVKGLEKADVVLGAATCTHTPLQQISMSATLDYTPMAWPRVVKLSTSHEDRWIGQ